MSRSKSKSSRSKSRASGKDLDVNEAKIGFLGAGKITESIIQGLINFGKVEPSRIHVAAPTGKNLDKFKEKGCRTSNRNIDLFAKFDCDIIFLSVHGSVIDHCYDKGAVIPHALTINYIPNMKHKLHILSLVSGFNIDRIKPVLLNPEHPDKYILEMHRIVINAACAYGLGICAVDVDPDSDKLSPVLRTMLSSIARLEHVPESQMDAACALCGAGLAFSYYFIQAMADGAFKCGLNRQMCVKFAAKTMQCAAQSLLESGKHPSELRDSVSSPKGPAIYGIAKLDKGDVAGGIAAAVVEAYQRGREMAVFKVGDMSAPVKF